MTARRHVCIICDEPCGVFPGPFMCAACSRSYDRHAATDDGTLFSVLKWAAKRSREAERKRLKKAKGRS